MHELRIERRFFAAHALRLYDESLEPLHAHDWGVLVEAGSPTLDPIDVVVDFHELERSLTGVLDSLRGQNLNEHAELQQVNPSAERVAEHIYKKLKAGLPGGVTLHGVTVEESPGCEATHRE